MKLFDLTGRTALVTGARTGIGRAVAVGLAEAGAHVIAHGHTTEKIDFKAAQPGPEGAPATVPQSGQNRTGRWVYDLSRPDGLPDAVKTLPDIDILVNNAGIIRRTPAASHSFDQWRDVLTVNLDSVFLLTRLIGAGMLTRRRGKIIMIASMLSFQGGIMVPGYTASKHAVVGLTKALANEWAADNVQVNAIAPGYIETNNTATLRADPDREPAISARIPAGRWGTPEDLVGAAVFLAAPASDYVSGHVLAVDGGWLAR
jgi:2-deoxy-D-gluconate 3-dehydrogenase